MKSLPRRPGSAEEPGRPTLRDRGRALREYLRTHPLVLGLTLAVAAAGGLALTAYVVVIGLFYGGVFGPMPSEAELAEITTAEASRVVGRDGTELGKYFLQERVAVPRAEMSDPLVHALVATEDARFYDHRGVDLLAWGRVLVNTVIRGDEDSGGGSTLSQQLMKNLYGRPARHENPDVSLVINKLREVFSARRCERLHSKDEILALYLNTVAFPDNTYGVGVAARRYFDKSPAELTAEEAATLVGSLKATYTYDPLRHPRAARARRNTVLDLMAYHGYLTERQRDSLQELPIRIRYFRDEHNAGLATHFRERARLELKEVLRQHTKPDGRPYDLYTDGLTIETTIDAGMQAHAEEAVRKHLAELQDQFYRSLDEGERPWEVEQVYLDALKYSDRAYRLREAGFGDSHVDSVLHAPVPMRVYDYATAGAKEVTMSPADSVAYYLGMLNSGFLVVEPGSGAIRAWVGGTNHEFFKYDKVTSRRSVGSTFKPILYAAALKRGIDPERYWGNYRRTYWQYEGWSPRNSGDEYGGSYNMRGGLTNSLNTISVQLIMATGPKHVRELATEMGIESDFPAVPAIALGAGEISLREMLQAYSVFANRGQRVPLRYIERVVDRDGRVVFDAAADAARERERVLTVDQADLMTGMLESVVDDGTGRRLRWRYKFEGDIAGKTGTSQNHSDGWFIGYTPRLLAGAWTGAESPAVRFRTIKFGQGAHMALPIWGEFMGALRDDPAYAHYLGGQFAEPAPSVAEVLEAPMRYYAPTPEPGEDVIILDGVRTTRAQMSATSQPTASVKESVAPAADRAAAPTEGGN